jgi:hypothetical protein
MPLSIVMGIDASLSTRKDLPLELESARRFVHAIIRPVDGMSVYKFSETVSQMVPFTNDLKSIDEAIDPARSVRPPRSTTPSFSAPMRSAAGREARSWW